MSDLTPRELVQRTLRFERTPRVPRQLMALPWAEQHYSAEVAAIRREFPDDLVFVDAPFPHLPHMRGVAHEVGTYVDEWGCTFINIHPGVIGEVKDPLVKSYASDLGKVRPPKEWLTFDVDPVNRACAATDRFTLGNTGLLRPFERMQFLRGTTHLLMDLVDQPAGFFKLRDLVHEWNLAMLERWLETDVDAMGFMDDWGTQRSLLVRPELWRSLFKDCYRTYADRIRRAGKFVFFHSDGYILDILEDLVEIGVDAVNSQLFCMDIERVGRQFKGRLTFWGEIDRQHILPAGTVNEVRHAVRRVAAALYDGHGGVIAECEFGPAARPENVRAVFDEWDRISRETPYAS